MSPGPVPPRRSTALGYALLAPSLFGVVAFLLLPILVVLWLSLHRWNLLGPIEYVGGENWRSVLSDSSFGNSLLVTLTFVAIVVPTQTVLGLAVASLLARDLPGSGLFRTIYVLKSRRQQLHGQIARALQDGFPEVALSEPEVLARHFTEAGLVQAAIDYWLKAGHLALSRSANAEAVERLRRGIELLHDLEASPERVRKELDLSGPRTGGGGDRRRCCDRNVEGLCARPRTARRWRDPDGADDGALG